MNVRMNAYICACIHIHEHSSANTHTCIQGVRERMTDYVNKYVHFIYIYVCVHTYTYIHMYVYSRPCTYMLVYEHISVRVFPTEMKK